jgi:hypothetical protein
MENEHTTALVIGPDDNDTLCGLTDCTEQLGYLLEACDGDDLSNDLLRIRLAAVEKTAYRLLSALIEDEDVRPGAVFNLVAEYRMYEESAMVMHGAGIIAELRDAVLDAARTIHLPIHSMHVGES